MTELEFLEGKSFVIESSLHYKGEPSYKWNPIGCIIKESRSSINEELLGSCHHLNVVKLDSSGFDGFASIMNHDVSVRIEFSELRLYEVGKNDSIVEVFHKL